MKPNAFTTSRAAAPVLAWVALVLLQACGGKVVVDGAPEGAASEGAGAGSGADGCGPPTCEEDVRFVCAWKGTPAHNCGITEAYCLEALLPRCADCNPCVVLEKRAVRCFAEWIREGQQTCTAPFDPTCDALNQETDACYQGQP